MKPVTSTDVFRSLVRDKNKNETDGMLKNTNRPELGWGLDMTKEKQDNVLRVQRGVTTMEERLMRHNIEAPLPEQEVGLFRKVLGFLSRAETAPAIMAGIRGENMGRAYWQGLFGAEPLRRISYADVFSEMGWRPDTKIGKWLKGVTGLAADILLDPTTWITFGKGGAVKIKTKKGELALNKTGGKIFRNYVKEHGDAGGRKTMATFLQNQKKEGIEKYIEKDGLKFMGHQIPVLGRREVVTSPFKFVDWMGRNTPVVDIVYTKAEALGNAAFIPFSEIKDLPAMKVIIKGHKKDIEEGVAFKELYLRKIRGTRAEQREKLEQIKELGKRAKKALPEEKELAKTLTNALETGRTTGFRVLDNIIDTARTKHKEMLFLEEKYKITTSELPNYLKHVVTREGKEWIDKGGDILSRLSKPLKVKLTKSRNIQGTIKDINKEWVNKYGFELFEEDFFKIYGLRTAEHIQNVRTYDFLQEVGRRWGVEAKTQWKQSVHPVTGEVTRKKITKADTIPVKGGVRFVESTIPQLKGVLLPEPIVKMVDEYHKFINEEEVSNAFLGMYDKVLRFWKISVTGVFPAFHARNVYGSMWNNWLSGLKNPIRYKQAHDIVRKKKGAITTNLGVKYSYSKIEELLKELGLHGQPGMLDTMRTVEDLLEKGTLKKVVDFPLTVMEIIERRMRGALFVDRLVKGDAPKDAAKLVFQTLFDYAPEGLTNFERTVMRRVIPFYTWARNNIPFQTMRLIKQPGKFSVLPKFERMFNDMAGEETSSERQLMPNWMAEQFSIRLPGASPRYMSIGLPAADLNLYPIGASGWRNISAMISPFLKYPVERLINRNMQFGGELWNPDLPRHLQTRETVISLQRLPVFLQNYLKFKEITKKDPTTGKLKQTYQIDARKIHALRTFLGRFYSSYARAIGEDQTTFDKLSHLLTGTPIREIDITERKQRKLFNRQRQLRELTKAYRKRGLIPMDREEKTDDIRDEMRIFADKFFRIN